MLSKHHPSAVSILRALQSGPTVQSVPAASGLPVHPSAHPLHGRTHLHSLQLCGAIPRLKDENDDALHDRDIMVRAAAGVLLLSASVWGTNRLQEQVSSSPSSFSSSPSSSSSAAPSSSSFPFSCSYPYSWLPSLSLLFTRGRNATVSWCEDLPISSRPIYSQQQTYVEILARIKEESNLEKKTPWKGKPDEDNEEDEDNEDRIYGELADADFSWASRQGNVDRMAICQIQANEQLEDRGLLQEIHTISNGPILLAGVMDGHGGWQVAEYVQRKIGAYIERFVNKKAALKPDCTQPLSDEELAQAMTEAFIVLDEVIMHKVKGTYDIGLSKHARVGACCVVALITKTSIVVANAGDCAAVVDHNGTAYRLSDPHSANEEKERARLRLEHPGEDDIVVCKDTYEIKRSPKGWLDYPWYWIGFLGNDIRMSGCYVKNRLQPTRSFGDFYLKAKDFSYDFESKKCFFRDGASFPYITAEPTTRIFQRTKGVGQFLLLASDGVWDFLTNEEAISTARTGMQTSPQVAAANVIQTVLRKASDEAKISVAQILTMTPSQKRKIYDDTTVCIVKLND